MRGNRLARKRQRTCVAESLECRRLLAANIHLTNAYLVDQNLNPAPSPIVGTTLYVHVDFTTTDLPAGATYTISQTIYGVTYSHTINSGAGVVGTGAWQHSWGGWSVQRGGGTSASVTLDSQNTVVESNEGDNAATIPFTPTQLPLPAKLAQPLGGVAERTYGYVNYTDRNPASPAFVDYRGGPYTYDGHDAIDMSFANFASMDAGTPVLAAEAGTVTAAVDGNFDRNTASGAPNANYVVIDSGNGYQQYYYHLRNGSVGVQVGQVVAQGQVLGLMGSSGNSTGPHLHFALYNGGAVETYESPYTYWQNPVPYQGDVEQVIDSGVTNYSPTSILNVEERPPEYRNFKQQSGQTAYAWFSPFLGANAPGSITFYRPSGATYFNLNFTTGASPLRSGYYYASTNLPSLPDLGTWQAALRVNGVELARNSFSVTSTGAPGARVDQGATFIANLHTTPIDGGTYTQNAAATALSFTVKNFGNATLNLGTPALPPGWVVTDPLVSTLAAGASDTLGLMLDTAVPGYRYGFLSFTTDDPNAPTYRFALQGTVTPTAAVPAVSIYSRSDSAAESGRQPGTFRISRTGSVAGSLTVNLSISGSAGNGVDDVAIPTTVTIPAGQSDVSVIVTPIDDAGVESTETVILSLVSSASYSIAPNSAATVSIADNDGVGSASISGTVYLDSNFNTYRDAGETTLGGIGLFLDTNSDGVREAGEAMTTTDGSGSYTFGGLVAGRYNVREFTPSAYVFTTPVGSYAVAAGGSMSGVDFGAFPTSFTGTGAADNFTVSPGPTAARIQINVNGTVYSALRSQIPTLSFAGAGGNDTLQVDLSGGAPLTSQSVLYDGGGGVDAVSMTGGRLTFTAPQMLSSLTIASGATVSLANSTTATVVNSLADAGRLDVGNSKLIVEYTGASPLGSWTGSAYTGILGLVASGRNGGSWNGNGIVTSVANGSVTSLGVAEASEVLGISGLETAQFGGQTVDATTVLVKYTYAGDANLGGRINVDDYGRIDSNIGLGTAGWYNGDFNYDGKVNVDDYGIIDGNIGIQGPPLLPAALASDGSRATSLSRSVVSWPRVVLGEFGNNRDDSDSLFAPTDPIL